MDDSQSRPMTAETSLSQDLRALFRYWSGGRRGVLIAGAFVVAGGLWFGWPSLVAAGIAPLLVALAPCALMCALGVCMKGHGHGGGHDSGESGDAKPHVDNKSDNEGR